MNHHKYTPRAIGLHWLLAIALVAQIGLGLYMADIPKGVPNRAWYFNLHKSIGIVAALLIFYRLWWRSRNPVPTLPITMPVWEQVAARVSHRLLYVCMVVLPVSGYIGSNFTKYGVKFFGLQIPPWGWEDKNIYAVFNTTHEITAWVFIVTIGIHVLAALKHWLLDKDEILQRMLP